jgi:hypothetical protein
MGGGASSFGLYYRPRAENKGAVRIEWKTGGGNVPIRESRPGRQITLQPLGLLSPCSDAVVCETWMVPWSCTSELFKNDGITIMEVGE